MQMVDEILSDSQIDRLDKIKRLEEILSAATSEMQVLTDDSSGCVQQNDKPPERSKCTQCSCSCHTDSTNQNRLKEVCDDADVACQTLSTGDIVITKIWFTEDKKNDKILLSSVKKSS